MGLASIGTKEQERIAEELADISAGITVQSSSLYSGFFQQNTLLDHIDENENILAVVNEPPETKKTGIDWQEKADGLLNLKQKRFELPLGFSKPYFEWEQINSNLAKFKTLGVTRYQMGPSNESFPIPIYPAPSFNSSLH